LTERGSISVVTAASLAFAAVLAALGADLARATVTASRIQWTADAAALAAAQELVRPSGRTPAEVAAEYAERAGARMVACRCDVGASDVVVEVAAEVLLPFLGGSRTVRRAARAVAAAPAGTEGLAPWFAARLGCLFERVPGLVLVSGYRTREHQARLHEEKPRLAAPPGRSMHELGLAADLGYANGEARSAAHREAPGCGLRFPVSHEPWHAEPAP
jgi:hypothetical protein